MEISEPTIGIFYVSKILALAPFTLSKNAKNFYETRRSVSFTLYTVTVILAMVILTYRGLLFDANSKVPVRASFRMKSATSKVVTALDVSVVVMATTAGVLSGLLGLRATRELNKRLRKIDESLHCFDNYKRDRIRSIVLITVPLATITSLLGLDIWTWFRFAEDMKVDDSNTELNVQWYIPFYSLYFILVGLQMMFANTAFGIFRRYHRLNLMLRRTFLSDDKKKYDNPSKQKITTVKTLSQSNLTLHGSLTKLTGEGFGNESPGLKNKVLIIRLMAENHESLGKCVDLVSSSYGIAVLFILVSCLLHLVATAYFLFLELLTKKDYGYLWLQVLWIIFHTLRLLLVVEPCHYATRESKKTMHIICEIERKIFDPILTEEVKKFWQQLIVLESDFSASGLCKVNRNILTSFSSAIATYLVILIQFQKSNG